MGFDFTITEECRKEHWKGWQQLVTQEEWTAFDRTLFDLYPGWHSARVAVALRKHDGAFLGCIVWNEQDGVACLDTYNVVTEARGKGVGSALWRRMMEGRDPRLVLTLRSVPEMTSRYMATDFPFKGPDQYTVECSAAQLQKMFDLLEQKDTSADSAANFKSIHTLNCEEKESLLRFDFKVTQRDRRRLLTSLLGFDYLMGGVLLNAQNEVCAYALLAETIGEETFRLAPLYAERTSEAARVARAVLDLLNKPDAKVHVYLTETTKGFDEMMPIFEEIGVEREFYGTTLYSREYRNPVRKDLVYVIHDNFLHFDM